MARHATVVVFVGNVVARGLGFLFPLVLARVTEREEFALVYFYVNTGYFVGELVLAGYPTALTRHLAAPGGLARGTWVSAALVGGIPMLAGSFVVALIVAGSADASPLLLGLVVVGLSIDAYYFAALRGIARYGLLVGYRIAANLAQILLLLLAAALGIASIELAVAIYALVYLVPIVLIEASLAPIRSLFPAGATVRGPLRSLTRFAVPALVSGTAYAAIQGLDVFFVRLLAAPGLPDYAGARALAAPMSLVSFAIGVVLLPEVAASDPATRIRLLARALLVAVALGVVAVAGYVVAGPAVTALVYPASFRGIPAILPWLAAAMGVTGTYSVLSQWWMGTGRPWPPAAALTVGAIVAVVAHWTLDPLVGAVGGAWSMAIGGLTAFALLGALTLLQGGDPERSAPTPVAS